jgi:hypothetical protein
LLPLTLLIIVGLAGLRGGMAAPKWDGPMVRDELAVGLAVEIVFAILIAIALLRTESGGKEPVAVKLRGVLIFVLAAGMVAVAVVTLVGLHLHLFSPKRTKLPTLPKASPVPVKSLPTGSPGSSSFHISAQILLYVLLPGDGEQPGRPRRGPGRSRHARRTAGARHGNRPGARHRRDAADRAVLRSQVLQSPA